MERAEGCTVHVALEAWKHSRTTFGVPASARPRRVAGVCVRLLRRAWVARVGEGVRGDRVNDKAARGPAGWCAASGMVRARRQAGVPVKRRECV